MALFGAAGAERPCRLTSGDALMIKTIPLNKLVASPGNVRRRSDPAADAELKADIAARGLLQNLVVTSVAKPRGCFAVEAGERRRRALQSLADEGSLAKDHQVCCLVIDRGAAQEASLAENFQRLSMNPADECLAFRQLIEQGADAEGVARRFGLTVRFVEGRLRLAGLAPIVFEALGAGEISLDVAKAYAATADQERQAHVFEQMSRGYGAAHPDSIRRMITQASVGAGDRRALFVGEEAYLAAGGRIERDLFSEEAGERWLDIALLERLAAEKLEALAAQAAKEAGLGFVRPTLERWISSANIEGLRRLHVEAAPLSDDENAEIDRLEREIEELAGEIEDEECGDEERDAAEARIGALAERIEAIVDKPPVLDDELKPHAGAFLMIDEAGRAKLDHARYVEIADDPDATGGDGGARAAQRQETAPRRAALSQRLVDELAIQRRDILAVHVAADPAFALDLATFLMIDREAGCPMEKSGSSLCASPPPNPVFDFKTPDSAATIAGLKASDALERGWTAHSSRSERFDAFRALPGEARAAWLGHAVARTLEASLNLAGSRACAFHDHLGRLLGIDVARWWRPTAAYYFDRVPKSVALAALAEVGGPALAERHAKAKKAELAEACERIFAGDFIGEVDAKQAALAWVPEAMRFAAPPAAESVPGDAESGEGALSSTETAGIGEPCAEAVEEAA